MALSWTFRAHSEIGLVRKNNQDSGFVGRHLLLVADGMGGAAAGDLASAVAVDEIKRIDERFAADPSSGTESDEAEHDQFDHDHSEAPDHTGPSGTQADLERSRELLTEAIRSANLRIADLVTADYTLEGMGTTVTAGVLAGDRLSLAHLGDSRAYLLRDGQLEQLTHDHSWVQSLVDDGKISEAEAAVHPHRSLLLKVLNGQPAAEPDLTTVDLQAGDRLLFCSDGLCGFVDDDAIASRLSRPDLDEAMSELVDAAHQAGGLDNITIVIADFDQDGPVAPDLPQTLGSAAERTIPPARSSRPDGSDPEPDGRASADPEQGDRPSEEDEDRYAPQAPDKRRLVRPLIGILVVVLILGAALGAGFAWSRTQYYVGADGDQVAIFQGISNGPPGLPLSRVYEIQQLPIDTLPPLYADMVRGSIDVADLSAARVTVEQLRQAAAQCQQQKQKQNPTPTPGSTPTDAGQSTASGSPKPSSPRPPSNQASTRPSVSTAPPSGSGC